MAPDYSKGKIYKLTAGNLTYYGSTVLPLNEKFDRHKQTNHTCTSKKLFESGEEVKIHLVEHYPCKSKKELREREGYYQKNFECLNERIEGRTPQEYRKDNKETLTERKKQYRENNRKVLAEKQKQYAKNHKESIAEYKRQYFFY